MVVGCALSGLLPAEAGADGGAPDLFQKSYDAEALGKVQDALTALDQLPAPQKDGYVAQLRRGWLEYKLGKNTEAVDAYNKASALQTSSVESRVGALAALMAARRWSEVEAPAKEVLKNDPGNYLANLRLAFAYYNLARYAESAALYKKLADMYPGDVEVRSGLGWALLKGGKAADAMKEFQAILEIAPKNALAREGLSASCSVK
jgi:tetratricopeptide (TPR) repeat protein